MNKECKTCKHWIPKFIFWYLDKQDLIHGECPYKKGTIDDIDPICKEYILSKSDEYANITY